VKQAPAAHPEPPFRSSVTSSTPSGKQSLNWSSAAFRLWVVASVLWVGVIAGQTAVAFHIKPSIGWFIHSYTIGSDFTPSDAERLLEAQISRFKARANSGADRAPDPNGYREIAERLADERLDEMAAVWQSRLIFMRTDVESLAAETGLTATQIALDEEKAVKIVSGLKLVSLAKAFPKTWPSSFDTRQTVHAIDWPRLLGVILGAPLLALGFGLTLRWIARGLIQPV